jgi:hypothetical protein
MFETYKMLGSQHEQELLRDAKQLRAAHTRESWLARGMHRISLIARRPDKNAAPQSDRLPGSVPVPAPPTVAE